MVRPAHLPKPPGHSERGDPSLKEENRTKNRDEEPAHAEDALADERTEDVMTKKGLTEPVFDLESRYAGKMLYIAAHDHETVVHGHSPNHHILCSDGLAGGIQAGEDVTGDDGLLVRKVEKPHPRKDFLLDLHPESSVRSPSHCA
jgi:hypothetical protein